jgi:Rne/Rng family ribonuclease
MNKEVYVSTTPHETKVAMVEDDQLAEIYFERENEYTLAGSIYKGRVTRVLPGMQSAFVDIGLERDAFLYVSDFLELEDEDEEFGEVKVGPPQALESRQQAAPYAEPVANDSEESASGDDSEGEDGGASAETSAEGSGTDESGARKWRGRRRRRGGRRGRERSNEGQPQSAEVNGTPATQDTDDIQSTEPEDNFVIEDQIPPAPSAPSFVAPTPGYEPIVLPGESISKYRNGGEASASGQVSEPEPPRERTEFRDRGDRHDRGGRDRGGRGGRDRFGRRDRNDRDRGDRDRGPREPREPEVALPSNYQPIVLPGESISKYRGQPAAIHDDQLEQSHSEAAEVAEAYPAESPVSVLPTFSEEPQHDVIQGGYREEQEKETRNAAPVIEQEKIQHHAEPANDPDPTPTFESSHERTETRDEKHEEPRPEPKTRRWFDRMNVASIFGGNAVEEEKESEPQPTVVIPPQGQFASRDSEVLSEGTETSGNEAGSYFPQGGHVEHEVIDEEEADTPNLSTDDHEGYQAGDFEEETMDRNGLISDAVRDAETDEATEEEEYDFNEQGQVEGDEYEFEESELVASGEGEDPEVDETNGRAELRAPAGTAGYQQRTERPSYERRDRNDRSRRDRDQRGSRRGGGGGRMRMRAQSSRTMPMISDLLKEGQEILVQIAKEPIGKKGARITSHIALPGRFLVFMPTVNHIGVSRKINSDEERQRLKRIVASERENGHGGFIVRTAAANIREDELRADIRFLKHLWSEIKNRADSSKSPALIYHDLNLVERVLRDQVTQDFSQIWVDNEQEYERVVRFANRFQSGLVRRIKLYTKDTPLFEQFGIQEEINKSLKSKVWLKSGGYIVINQTEALVAIDINTGKYVGKTTRLEDTIVKTNVDAIKEIVRQIRLRDLGGIIVIDFIDMDERKNRQKVMQALEEALKSDRAPSKVLQFNDFGLVAITRKRVKQSLERTLGSPCPYCTATGFVKSAQTVCNEIYSEMKKIAKHLDSKDVILRVHPEVGKELKGNNGKYVQEMEELTGRTILVKSDPLLHQEQFDIQG